MEKSECADNSEIHSENPEDLEERMEEIQSSSACRWNELFRKYSFHEDLRQSVKEGTAGYSEKTLELVRNFIEKKSGSPLKYIFIKLLSSYIKKDVKYHNWKRLMKSEFRILRETIEDEYIFMYLDNIIPPFNHDALIDTIENKHKSKLKLYIQMRKDKLKSEEESKSFIEREWKLLESKIAEEYICAYYVIFFGYPFSKGRLK